VALFGTQITEAGLVHLKPLTKLEGLGLRKTKTTDAGLPALHGLTNLRWIELPNPGVTEKGLKQLQQILPKTLVT
jgi:hypothetical protein